MEETTNNNSLGSKSLPILLVIIVIVLVGVFLYWKYGLDNKSVTKEGEEIYVSDPEMAEEIARLKAEQEEVLFDSTKEIPVEHLLGLPVDTNPVEIHVASVVKTSTTEGDVTSLSYAYFSILSQRQTIEMFKEFLSDEGYELEETNEETHSSIFAKKDQNTFSIGVSETDEFVSYVTISLTMK